MGRMARAIGAILPMVLASTDVRGADSLEVMRRPPAPYEVNDRGRVLHYRIAAPSLGEPAHSVRVFVPRGYSDAQNRTRRYPVVYLLHGWPGGDGNWAGHGHLLQTLDSLVGTRRIPEVIAVMPNGAGAGLLGRSFYVNSYDGASRMETFIVTDLVQWVDGAFRTRADSAHRAIVGVSEGASGAVNLAFRHPGLFNSCAGLSGLYDLKNGHGMTHVLGPEPGATRILAENSPARYAPAIVDQIRRQTIYFGVATGDARLADNRAFDRELDSLQVPHTYRESPGKHSWKYWSQAVHEALVVCLAGMW